MKKFTPKGEKSRNHILQTAIGKFALQGFDGTSVDEIVESAGVNKRMVYHYFGTKKGLYHAALSAVYRKLEGLEVETLHPEEPIEKILGDLVTVYFTFLQENHDFVNLILWENLQQGKSLNEMTNPISKTPVLDLLIDAVENCKRKGTVRKDLDPRFLLISLIGNCMIYCSNRFTLSRALQMDLQDPELLKEARESVIRLLLDGVKA